MVEATKKKAQMLTHAETAERRQKILRDCLDNPEAIYDPAVRRGLESDASKWAVISKTLRLLARD